MDGSNGTGRGADAAVTPAAQKAADPKSARPAPADRSRTIDLRDPYLALFLAWLIPGAGHIYQRRWGKGGLFMVCILGMFFVGMWMGEGRVVYASWRPADQRYPYICQIGVGLPALPALVQALRMGATPPKAPWFDGLMAPPLLFDQPVDRAWAESQVQAGNFQQDDFHLVRDQDKRELVIYTPAGKQRKPDAYNQLSDWNFRMGMFFELGTVYTVIAGLLNILAMYDAWGGPALAGGPPHDEPAAA